MAGRPWQQDEDVALDMGPLIDAVFLLLIFFLVTTMLKKDDTTVEEIDLPISRSALEMPPDDSQVVINIDEEGELYFMGEETTVQLLHEEMRALERDDPEARIRLDTDEETPFHRVVEVLDLLAFRNLRNVGVRTYHEKFD
ncbi:MAG: ExbD/TolR family protein [Puniceicoccaceae bacterium]